MESRVMVLLKFIVHFFMKLIEIILWRIIGVEEKLTTKIRVIYNYAKV